MSNEDSPEERNSSESPTVGGKQIQAVKDGDVEDILGYTVVYTIGPSFTVNRSWLEERAADLGLSPRHLPSETTEKRAFTRACKGVDDLSLGDADHHKVTVETEREDYSTFNVKLEDQRGDGLDVHTEIIGQLIYDDGGIVARPNTSVESYIGTFNEYSQAARDQMEMHGDANTGGDLRRAIREFVKSRDASGIKMRDAGAVYFVPRQAQDELMAFKQLIREVDQTWKTSGFECAVDTIEVIDSADKRNMVQRKVEKEIDDIVSSALDSAFDELDEESAAMEVVSEVGEDLVRAEDVAVKHNALLDVELSVKEVLENWKDRVSTDNKEDLIEKAAEEVDV